MYFRHWLFHLEQQHCEQSIYGPYFGMANPNLLKCSILTINKLPSRFLPPSLHLYPSIPPAFSSLPLLPYISLSYTPSLCSFLSLFFLTSFLLPSSFPLYLPFPLSHIFPSLYFPVLLFFLLQTFSLNPTLHDPSYSSIFLSFSILPLSSHPSLPSSISPSPHSLFFSSTHN